MNNIDDESLVSSRLRAARSQQRWPRVTIRVVLYGHVVVLIGVTALARYDRFGVDYFGIIQAFPLVSILIIYSAAAAWVVCPLVLFFLWDWLPFRRLAVPWFCELLLWLAQCIAMLPAVQ